MVVGQIILDSFLVFGFFISFKINLDEVDAILGGEVGVDEP